MNIKNERHLDAVLSQYLDGTLSAKEQSDVASLIAQDAAVRAKYEELIRLKKILGAHEPIQPDIGFWTRCSALIQEDQKKEQTFFPFSKRYIPAASVSIAAILLVTGIFLMQYRSNLTAFFSKKSQEIQTAYEKTALQDQLLPLFQKVDKDRALQFSLLGTLSLDDTSKTELRVDEQVKKGYRIEVGKDSYTSKKPLTFERFLAEVKPTSEQTIFIDSLLELTGKRIESSVLIGENNSIAISPDLPKLNKIMVANIASCLAPEQQAHFERFLAANNGPYSVASNTITVRKGIPQFQKIPVAPHEDHYVVITPDTMLYSRIHINVDSLRKKMEGNIDAFMIRKEAMMKRIQEMQRMERNFQVMVPAQPQWNEERRSIEIRTQNGPDERQQMQVIVAPRIRRPMSKPVSGYRSLQVRIWQDTTTLRTKE